MNVRFSEGALRCRVTRAELERLLAGRSIALEIALPRDHIFRVSIRPTTLGGWQLESDPTGVWLTIARSDLESLSAALPSKEGLEHWFDTASGGKLSVSFEVDLKDRNRR
ncbi:MAG TPA: hypothetical protein VHK24_13325 [Steroidobacter sp.]|jgi:hypothetical protein|nr:hypothetical protein [Steroidobacter sp.]